MKETQRRVAEGILFTDFYQLTMAQLYYRTGLHEKTVQFDHFFRDYPNYGAHQAGYCVNAGLEWLLDWMAEAHLTADEIEYLRGQRGRTGERLFADDFLRWLGANGTFEGLTLHAIPEGRVVHPNVPLTIVQGPMVPAQLLETSLLNHLNYQTLIATKAARMHFSGRGRLLLEFGVRRGHDRGANAGTRAALIGGADLSSNVGISRVLGYPPKGTHAHSMVQVFMALGLGELGAFRAYADLYPDDCLLLVDTIDSLGSGIPNAITVFEELRRKGHEPMGIRLDSGDLAYLSKKARAMLDAAGFPEAKIFASNDLDEHLIWDLKAQGAAIDVWGVGTKLITSDENPSLGGVYKMAALEEDGRLVPKIKVSENQEKTTTPGYKKVYRLYDRDHGKAIADLITLADETIDESRPLVIFDPNAVWKRMEVTNFVAKELLVPIYLNGKRVYDSPPLEDIQRHAKASLDAMWDEYRRLNNPHRYKVDLSDRLYDLKQKMLEESASRKF